MTDIVPVPNWGGVRQLETNEYARGGLNGNMNEQAKSLAGQNMYSRLYAGLPFDPVFTSQVGGFPIGGKVALENGDIVRSTVANNTVDPNVDMVGWINTADKDYVGLSNVDNTSDIDKPVSTATNLAIISATQDKVSNQDLISAVSPKADKTYVDSAVGAISTDGSKQYATLALANADISNIALNKNVFVSEEANGGYWYKATAGATSLTKSPYDPLTQAKTYTDQKTEKSVQGVVGKNLFNPNASDVAIGYFPSNTTGVLTANTSYNTTGFISVNSEQQYTISVKHYWCWYDANKTFISGTNDSNTNRTQTAPINAAYMRASARNTNLSWVDLQIEQGSVATTYEAYRLLIQQNSLPNLIISSPKIVSRSVGMEKVNFVQIGKNLFSKNAATIGMYVGQDGSSGSSANLCVSAYIPVISGQQYTARSSASMTYGIRFACFYDVAKNIVAGGINSIDTTATTFTAPVDAAYVRITINVASLAIFQLEAGAISTTYEAYKATLIGENGEQIVAPISENSVTSLALQAQSVLPSKTNFLQASKNLFNKVSATIGKYINGNSGELADNATYDTSDYIPVVALAQYTSNRSMRFHAFFDENKNFIVGGSNTASTTFTPPTGAAFARLTISHTDLDLFQIELGSTSTSFENYGYILKLLDNTPIFTDASSASKWKGMKWASLGDSITAMATWQGFVVDAHSFTWTNFGVSGTKVSGASGDANAMCQDTRINAIPVDTDLVTMMGGTNDWAQNVPLGDINSTDPLTFYGALNTFAQKAFTRWPTKRIAVATTPYGEIPDYTGRAGWTSPAHNSLGLTTNDYAEAIRQFCKRKNVHCIDVALSAGWGTYNITEALGGSTTDHLHPASGSNAAKGIGAAYIKGLKDIEPV